MSCSGFRIWRKTARLAFAASTDASQEFISSQVVIYSCCIISCSSLRVFLPLRLRFTASTRGSGYSWTDTSCLTFITKWNLWPLSTRYGYRETYRSPNSVNPSLLFLFLCTPRTNKRRDHGWSTHASSFITHHAPLLRRRSLGEKSGFSATFHPPLSILVHLLLFWHEDVSKVNDFASFFFPFCSPHFQGSRSVLLDYLFLLRERGR